VRAKAGKKQSAKDASGRTVHSAGASLRRYNELALKKVFLINHRLLCLLILFYFHFKKKKIFALLCSEINILWY